MAEKSSGIMASVNIVLALVLITIVGGIGLYISDVVYDTADSTLDSATVAATQTLTFSTNNFSDNDNVTIGTIIYELNSAGEVTATYVNVSTYGNLTIANVTAALTTAINANGTTSALVTATNPTTATVLITADTAGTAANSIATTEFVTNATWGAATMTGGVDVSTLGGMSNNLYGAGQTGSSFIVILVIAFIGSIAMTYLFGFLGGKRRV